MGSISINVTPDVRKPYYDFLGLDVKDYGEQKLEEKQVEIEQRETQKMQTGTGSSNLTYILFGAGAAIVIALAVLKKKGVI